MGQGLGLLWRLALKLVVGFGRVEDRVIGSVFVGTF